MRKLSLLFMVLMLSMLTLPSKADTITQNFDGFTAMDAIPDGWYLATDTYGQYTQPGGSAGVNGTSCINFNAQGWSVFEKPYDHAKWTTAAKAGTVSIKVRPNSSSNASGANSFVAIYKMSGNPTDGFTVSEELVNYKPVSSIPNFASDWKTWNEVKVDLAEDCYIAIAGCDCYVDDYVNETAGGGGDEEPEVITEPFESWSSIPQTDPKGSGTLDNGWGYINNLYGYGIAVGQYGVNSSKGIKFQYNGEGNPAIITEAKAGTVSIQVNVYSRGDESDNSGYFAFYKMVKNADGSYDFGDELVKYSPLKTLPGFSTWNGWYTVSIDLDEDTLLGISGFLCSVDNYENVVKTGGSGDEPAEEWELYSSENFNTVGSGSSSNGLEPSTLPEGWYCFGASTSKYNYTMMWPNNGGVDNSPAIQFKKSGLSLNSDDSQKSFLVTYVKPGKVSFMIKATSSSYLGDDTRGWLAAYKMDGAPGSFTKGAEIFAFDGLGKVASNDVVTVTPDAISSTDFTKVEFEVAEEGWISFTTNWAYFDNFENLVKVGGDTPATETVTTEEDFDPKGDKSGNYSLYPSELPTGWYAGGCLNEDPTYNAGWSANAGVDGSACLKISTGYSATEKPYLITYAHKGTASIMVKATYSSYVDDDRAYIGFYNVSGEPGAFTIGEAIVNYPRLIQANAEMSANAFVPVEVEIPADGYIAISANQCYLDNFRNTYEQEVAAGYTVSGMVMDPLGASVAGAKVSLTGCPEATTAEDGSFSFTNVSGKNLVLSISADGFETYKENLDVESDININVNLEYTKSVMVVTATDYFTNLTTPVFTLYDGETPICENVGPNEEGKYVFTVEGVLNPDGYTLKGQAKYFDDYSSPVKVNDSFSSYPKLMYGQSTNSTVYLTARKLSLTITVLDSEQEYLTNATVTFAYPEGSGLTYSRYPTDNGDGTYTFTEINAYAVADKECPVTCSVPEMKPVEPQTVVFDDQDRYIEFTAFPYEPTVITGRVTDLMGQPVTNARLTLFEGTEMAEGYQEAEVSPEGFYSFTLERFDCSYMLVAGAENYEAVEPVIFEEIEREQTYTQDFTLEKTMYTFTATVKNENGEVPSGAAVTLNGEQLGMNEQGDFFTAIWAGDAQNVEKYVAVASAEGYVSQEFEFDLYREEHVTHDFVLETVPVYTIAGQLLDAETKEPIADEFAMLIMNGELTQSMMTDAEGRFSFTVSDASATYGLMGNALGYDAMDEGNPVPVPELIPNGTVNVNVELQPTYYTITVNVKDEQGAPVTDATVTLTNAEGAELATENKGDGTYTYAAAEKKMTFGQYTLTVACEGFQPYTDQFEVEMYTYEINVDATIIKNGIASLFAGQQGAVNANGKIYVLGNVRIFSVNGMIIRTISTQEPVEVELEPGIYIVEGRKMLVK